MSGKRKGLSADDKQKVILQIYHEEKCPFNLKEIENKASKRGVVQQTIKDMNQQLVYDNLVLTDKIGSANFFWSFPSKVIIDKKNSKKQLETSISSTEINIKTIEESIEIAKEDRKGDNRSTKLERIEFLQDKLKSLNNILEINKFNDPAEINKIDKQAIISMDSANRWTDNLWTLKRYLVKKKGMNGKEIDKMLKLDSEFDYVSEVPASKKRKN
jgi:hypothetical protein